MHKSTFKAIEKAHSDFVAGMLAIIIFLSFALASFAGICYRLDAIKNVVGL